VSQHRFFFSQFIMSYYANMLRDRRFVRDPRRDMITTHFFARRALNERQRRSHECFASYQQRSHECFASYPCALPTGYDWWCKREQDLPITGTEDASDFAVPVAQAAAEAISVPQFNEHVASTWLPTPSPASLADNYVLLVDECDNVLDRGEHKSRRYGDVAEREINYCMFLVEKSFTSNLNGIMGRFATYLSSIRGYTRYPVGLKPAALKKVSVSFSTYPSGNHIMSYLILLCAL
jgi:hypothetical protein